MSFYAAFLFINSTLIERAEQAQFDFLTGLAKKITNLSVIKICPGYYSLQLSSKTKNSSLAGELEELAQVLSPEFCFEYMDMETITLIVSNPQQRIMNLAIRDLTGFTVQAKKIVETHKHFKNNLSKRSELESALTATQLVLETNRLKILCIATNVEFKRHGEDFFYQLSVSSKLIKAADILSCIKIICPTAKLNWLGRAVTIEIYPWSDPKANRQNQSIYKDALDNAKTAIRDCKPFPYGTNSGSKPHEQNF